MKCVRPNLARFWRRRPPNGGVMCAHHPRRALDVRTSARSASAHRMEDDARPRPRRAMTMSRSRRGKNSPATPPLKASATGPWRVMRPTFLSDTCWPHLWPKPIQTADLVVALLILHRKTCSDFPNSIPVAFCAIGRLHPAWPPNAHGAPRWSCIEARLHQMLDTCC